MWSYEGMRVLIHRTQDSRHKVDMGSPYETMSQNKHQVQDSAQHAPLHTYILCCLTYLEGQLFMRPQEGWKSLEM